MVCRLMFYWSGLPGATKIFKLRITGDHSEKMISLRSPLWSMGKIFFVAPGGPDHKNMGPHTMGKLSQSSFFMFSSLTL